MSINQDDEVVYKLARYGIVPVIKLEDTSKALNLADALRRGGLNCAEVTFRAKDAEKVINSIVSAYPDMIVGAGTVLDLEQARRAIGAGAKFLVAPGLNPTVVKFALDNGVTFIPGVSSASEIELALSMGLKRVKFFPAEQAGGIGYIKALSAPYTEVEFMPTGGINENNISDYLAFDKVFACGGSWMVSAEFINTSDWNKITELTKSAVNKMLGFELAHIGINCDDGDNASKVADLFSLAFGFENKNGEKSIFSSNSIELMKSKFLGANGHIGFKTNSVFRAIAYMTSRGFNVDESTIKYDSKNKISMAYFKESFGGFAVHLIQKK